MLVAIREITNPNGTLLISLMSNGTVHVESDAFSPIQHDLSFDQGVVAFCEIGNGDHDVYDFEIEDEIVHPDAFSADQSDRILRSLVSGI